MKFHTTLGLRQTHCVVFIFISMNTMQVMLSVCHQLEGTAVFNEAAGAAPHLHSPMLSYTPRSTHQ